MGNCLFGGLGDPNVGLVKVITSNGGVLELYTPVTAGCIINEFPGHSIFPSQDLFWRPLSLDENLHGGHSYYLLPINSTTTMMQPGKKAKDQAQTHQLVGVREGHVRSKSNPTSVVTPYRMSLDYQGMLKRSYTEVFFRHNITNTTSNLNKRILKGYWKVKLVISPEQLLEILSHEDSTEELIENVRAVAKCGGGRKGIISASSGESCAAGFSDQWSLSSSSRNASSSFKDDALVVSLTDN